MPISVIEDIANLRAIPAAVAANSGSIAIENVAGTLKQVDDQGVASSLGGGGSGTIHTSAPLSGDGSVGTPATIAAGAVALTKLAVQADQTIVGNVSGGSASPVALTAAQIATLLAANVGDSAQQWAAAQYAIIKAAVPALNRYKTFPLTYHGVNTTTEGSDANLEGGAATATASAFRYYSTTIWQLAKSGKWGISFRASYGAPVTGRVSQIGLQNAAGSRGVTIATDFDGAGSSHTNYVLRVVGAPSYSDTGIARDANFHDFIMTSDGTNIKVWIDGTLNAATLATSTMTADEPMAPILFNTAAFDANILFLTCAWAV